MPLTRGFLCFPWSERPGRTKLMKRLTCGNTRFPWSEAGAGSRPDLVDLVFLPTGLTSGF